ncbi:MAG: histidinol dehydrogenase [Clostridiales bacterium]|jgi:histidinol dehydrogenase|nr:histidinol dehydrogenase [Clostridiales bacterium]
MIQITEYGKGGADMPLKRLKRGESDNAKVQTAVNEIVNAVRAEGDQAVLRYTDRFDHARLTPETLRVSDEEIWNAAESVPKDFSEVLKRSYDRIMAFHIKQKSQSWFETSPNGEILGQLVRPVACCGVYVPGGKAAYPSSVLMNLAPAKAAGVKRIVMVTPPGSNGKATAVTLAAALTAGVTEIYKVGGAQAVAALAYGTETIPKVDKITGPGNIYVQLAKKSVFGEVGVDSIAGPSEVLVLADSGARPEFVAADMLSQAEHDEMAAAILVTDSRKLAERTALELERQKSLLSRRDIIEKSLADYGEIIITDNLRQGAELVNRIAPEHLELAVAEPFALLPYIQNAGSIFLGHYSPEPLGDYMAGPNHVLPTGGTARFFSALSVDDFVKKSGVISFSKEALAALADDIILFADAEGFTAHAGAVKIRGEK